MIKIIDTSITTVKEVYFKEKLLGHFIMAQDGYYLFYPKNISSGGWSSNYLKMIENELNKLNSKLEKEIDDYFYQQKKSIKEQARVEYKHLIHSGLWFELYPHLTGFWEEDKNEWFNEYKKLCDAREDNW